MCFFRPLKSRHLLQEDAYMQAESLAEERQILASLRGLRDSFKLARPEAQWGWFFLRELSGHVVPLARTLGRFFAHLPEVKLGGHEQ